MKVPRCKGTRDLMPQDMARFRQVEAKFRDCCLGWGYQEIRTPTLEYLHLFTSAGTLSPEHLGRVYSFLDWDGWSGERVALRPDGTIPAARLYVEKLGDMPIAKLFYVENVFAFEGTGAESRERWQCGIELIGGSKPDGDIEIISLGMEAIAGLGIDCVEIRLAHAGLLKAFLERRGLSGEEEADVLDRIFSGDLEVLGDIKGGDPNLGRDVQLLFGTKGSTAAFVENLSSVLGSPPDLAPSLDELGRIAAVLTDLGFDYQIDFTSGRGFEYYTGVIFSFYHDGRRLGGGGRYDELIPLVGGGNVRASGLALSVEQLMELLEEPPPGERILLKAKGLSGSRAGLEVARVLREAGFIVVSDLGYDKPAAFRWVLDLDAGREMKLVDQMSGKKRRASSPDEVLRILKEVGRR
jgi:histidyl-tRNA synthetase